MSLIKPVPESEATDKVAQTYARIKETLGYAEIPEIFQLYARVPSFLQDFFMNYRKFVLGDGKLDVKTKAMVGLAVASTLRSPFWTSEMSKRVIELGGDDQAVADTIGIAASCAMYNAFFKFRDISGSAIFEGMSVGLRAHTFSGTALTDATVELINIAISDLNGCKPCTSGHVTKAQQLGVSDEAILEAVQCAATLAAGINFLAASQLA